MKWSIFIILLFFSLTFAKNNLIIDKNLQNFRQEYREFKWITKILCDKSFFEVYLAAGIELKKIENVMKNTSNYFEKWNSEILVKSLKFNANERFKIVKGNVKSLLQTASNIHQKGLNELFSGDLTSPSPPMEYLDDLFDEIEFHVEDVFEIYSNNSICVARMFKEFLPLFDEIVGEIIKIGKTMKIKIFKKYFKKSEEMAVDSDRYVKNFVQKLNDCVTTKDIDRCVIKVVNLIFHKKLNNSQLTFFRSKKRLNVMLFVENFIRQSDQQFGQQL